MSQNVIIVAVYILVFAFLQNDLLGGNNQNLVSADPLPKSSNQQTEQQQGGFLINTEEDDEEIYRPRRSPDAKPRGGRVGGSTGSSYRGGSRSGSRSRFRSRSGGTGYRGSGGTGYRGSGGIEDEDGRSGNNGKLLTWEIVGIAIGAIAVLVVLLGCCISCLPN